jgi:beta-glucosidase
MARVRFPAGFFWGTATASYQIEGAVRADGRGESIWDRFAHTPGKIAGGDTGDVACDSYHRFDDDLALMRELGANSYRFSIAWPRIQPSGRGAANAKGLDYYRRVVDSLLAAGIRPLPTLYHWDLPQALQDAGGWPARDTAGRFADYTELVLRALGDRVSDWMLLNEPGIFTSLGYWMGLHAPGLRDVDAFYRAVHVVNLAQGAAAAAARAVRPGVRLAVAYNFSPCEPARDTQEDQRAAERFHAYQNLLFLEPALHGRYPEPFDAPEVQARMGVRDGDLERMRAPLDWIGVNLYMRTLVRHLEQDPLGLHARPEGMGGRQGPKTDFGWEVWPDSLYDLCMRLTRDYDRPVLEVTENGCSYGDGPGPDGRIHDERRIEYYRGYLAALARAIEDGADVRGYHAWTLLDNFEWAEGFRQRFGLAWVDFATRERTLKESGRWLSRVFAENGFDH